MVEATWIEERPIALPVAGEDLLAAAPHRLDKLGETGPELAQGEDLLRGGGHGRSSAEGLHGQVNATVSKGRSSPGDPQPPPLGGRRRPR